MKLMTLSEACDALGLDHRKVAEQRDREVADQLDRDVRRERGNEPPPMTLAEAAECCGQYRWDAAVDDARVQYCANCPLLVERKREEFLRQARAH